MQHAGKRNPIMVKMVPLGDHLLLQWMAPKSFKEPRVLDLNVNDYVDDTPSAEDAAGEPGHCRAIPCIRAMVEIAAGMQQAHVNWNAKVEHVCQGSQAISCARTLKRRRRVITSSPASQG